MRFNPSCSSISVKKKPKSIYLLSKRTPSRGESKTQPQKFKTEYEEHPKQQGVLQVVSMKYFSVDENVTSI